MNSRGTIVMCRINGDTLDSNEAVAITPRNQPAAAGTQENRRAWVRLAVSVIGRQDIRPGRRSGAPGLTNWPGELLPGAAPRFVGDGTGFTERPLQCRNAVAQWAGVRPQILGGGAHQARQTGYQPPGFVEIPMFAGVRVRIGQS